MSIPFAPHVVFAGGGTGGHLLPGLNIAQRVTQKLPDAIISFVGTGKPLERHVVREHGYQYVAIPSYPAPAGPLQAFRFMTDNVAGYWAARWLLRDQKASLVVGLGGLGSGAAIRAAAARGLPTVMLEQNAVPSLVSRWLARGASAICAGFEQICDALPAGANVHIVGNPVRPELEAKASRVHSRTSHSSNQPRRLVILGGNLGANTLNRVVPSALARVKDQLRGWAVVHQAGPGRVEQTVQRYEEAGVNALTVGILDDAADVLAESDLAVSRAGGTTLAELALVGAPAVIIPFPDAADGHQLANARIYAEAGACRVIDEESAGDRLDVELAAQLGALLADDAARGEMTTAIRQLARPDAASDIAQLVIDLAQGRTVAAA